MGLFGKKDSEVSEEFVAAPQIVNNPDQIGAISGKYAILYNQSIKDYKYNDLIKAINLMAENGWRCVNITYNPTSGVMYALMEKLS